MGSEGLGQQLQAQFAAQLEAVAALQARRLPTDSTVRAACRGRLPAEAVSTGGVWQRELRRWLRKRPC